MKKLFMVWIVAMWVVASTAIAEEPIRFGVAAMISPEETTIYYQRLIDYVGDKLGRPVQMVQRKNYDEMDNMLERGEVSIAFLCSGPYVKDHAKFGAELLVAPQAFGQSVYHAYIIVHKNSAIKDLAGLKGKKFAFTDPKSNTGKLVPTYMIAKKFKMTPEQFFSEFIYSGNHDTSVMAVAAKEVDGASVDSLIYDFAAKKKPVYTSQTKVILKSPSYGIPPIVIRKGADPIVREKIKNILLNMHKDPVGKFILDGIMVDKFIVPKDADYDTVREMDAWVARMK
jgi:phosphonate transport system substrate-binding protein